MQTFGFQQRQQALSNALKNSAFRYGTSAFRLGLVPMGTSDHLPIRALIPLNTQQNVELFSWNMLADDHLYNSFMNVSGEQFLKQAIEKMRPNGCIYHHAQGSRLYHFFAELAQYLFKKREQNVVVVNETVLREFIHHDSQPSLLVRSRDDERAKKNIEEIENAREFMMDLLLDRSHPHVHEFRMAIRHCMELIYHIQDEQGALVWKNRFKRLRDNESLVGRLINMDILCLQECTSPKDILSLGDNTQKNMRLIQHAVNDRTNDHCVIMYDADRFTSIGEPVLTSFEGKKPCIYVKLQDKQSGEVFIVSSIHHPGGEHRVVDEILQNVASLRQPPHQRIPYYVAGDFNHSESFFNKDTLDPRDYCVVFPKQATMAGSDYGNVNRSIDGVLTSETTDKLFVSRVAEVAHSRPAKLPLVLRFEDKGQVMNHASRGFFHQVQTPAPTLMVDQAAQVESPAEQLGKANATFAARPNL